MPKFAFPVFTYVWLSLPFVFGILYLVYKKHILWLTYWNKLPSKQNIPLLRILFLALSFILICFALAGPFWKKDYQSSDLIGRDIFIALDVSASMNATDLPNGRLEQAKSLLTQLMTTLKGDRFGIVVFTDHAYVLCPLTRDHEAAINYLELASSDQFVHKGTEYRSALSVILQRFIQQKITSDIWIPSRSIIWVSDGEDHGSGYVSLLERLLQLEVKVYPVAVGTERGGFIPAAASASERYITSEGKPILSQLNTKDMEYMAAYFDTDLVRMESEEQALAELYSQIQELSYSPIAEHLTLQAANRYQWFLLGALVFFSLFAGWPVIMSYLT
ncbi:MAG: VWA domain-containing protein [Bacteroidota bacterium]